MKHKFYHFFLLAFAVSFFPFSASAAVLDPDGFGVSGVPSFSGYAKNKIVVKFDPSVLQVLDKKAIPRGRTGIAALDQMGKRYGANSIRPQFPGAKQKRYKGRVIDLSGWHKIKFAKATDVISAVKAYKAIPGVVDAQPVSVHTVYATPDEQFYDRQWHLPKIEAPAAWDIETGNSDIIVAVLDTGVRYFAKDLGGANASLSTPTAINGNIWVNSAEKDGTAGVDDDSNGYIDDWVGYDFVETTTGEGYPPCFDLLGFTEDCGTADNDPRDFHGHGTHCAGNVAAINNNGEAVASPAGGWGNGTLEASGNGVKVMSLRIGWSAIYLGLFEIGLVEMDYAAEALIYAADKGARIASCSWGSGNTGGLGDAIDYFLASGGLIFKAAGNESTETPDYMGEREDIINVAATDTNDCKASFSSGGTNYGTWVDISAPGVDIWSLYHDKFDPVEDYVISFEGTSMATPLTASVAALIWSQNPGWSASQVKQRLFDSADPIDNLGCNSSYVGKLGAGRINAYEAVKSWSPLNDKLDADFNGDGKADLLWRHSVTGGVSVWLMDGISFSATGMIGPFPDLNWTIIDAADFNGDGKSDLLWRHSATGGVSVWLMDGISLSATGMTGTVPDLNWEILDTADFNGDGKADLLWRHSATGGVSVWLMDGISFSATGMTGTVPDLNWTILDAADFNGDGKSDLLWRHSATGGVSVWLMDGISFSATGMTGIVPDLNWTILDAADFNGDGKSDLLWRHSATGGVSVWLMDGISFSATGMTATVPDLNWTILDAADFNGDGKSDLLWRLSATGGVSVWLMDGISFSATGMTGIVPDLNWTILDAADFNGDGKSDLLWRHSATGGVSVWLMDGISFSATGMTATVPDLNWEIQ